MTVSSSTDRATFLGNNATTVFALPFRFFANGEINAWLITNATGALTALTLGTHYTLTGASDPEVDGSATGQLTMITPPTSAQSLFVQRIIPVIQPTDIVNQGQFFPEIHENVFDRLTMLNQQNAGALNRAIRVQDFDLEPAKLPSAAQRALKIMSFDADGNPVAIDAASDSSLVLRQDLANATDPAKGAGLVGWNRSALSAGITNSRQMLDAQEFSLWEFEGEIISKPNPSDFTTWDWAPAVQAAIDAPASGAQHIIKVPLGITIASTVTVNKGVRFVGAEPFDYVNAHFQQATDTALTMFRIRAHFVEFDGIVIEGPGKTGTSLAIEVGDGVTNWDKFAFINDSLAISWNTGIDIKTQNWAIRQGSAVSTCATGIKLTGMPTTADRRNGYIHGANIHSCDVGISVPTQWQILGITDCDFNSCGTGITGDIIRSVIANNLFFNGTGSDLVITASLQNIVDGNFAIGNVGVPAWTAPAFSITGETTTVQGNNIRNKGGHGIYAALSSSIISGNITVDCDWYDTTSFDGIHIAGGSNNIQGNVSRTTTGGASKQRYGINVASGTGNYVAGNTVNSNKTAQINAAAGNTIFKNPGYVTENSGTATISSASTSVVVSHGLAIAPAGSNVKLTPTSSWGSASSWYATGFTTSSFTIVCNVAPGSAFNFSWSAS